LDTGYEFLARILDAAAYIKKVKFNKTNKA